MKYCAMFRKLHYSSILGCRMQARERKLSWGSGKMGLKCPVRSLNLIYRGWEKDVKLTWLSLYFRTMTMQCNTGRSSKGREIKKYRRECDGANFWLKYQVQEPWERAKFNIRAVDVQIHLLNMSNPQNSKSWRINTFFFKEKQFTWKR